MIDKKTPDYLFFSSNKSLALRTYQNKPMRFLCGTGPSSSEKRTKSHTKSNGHLIPFNNWFYLFMAKLTFNLFIIILFTKQHLDCNNSLFGINIFGDFLHKKFRSKYHDDFVTNYKMIDFSLAKKVCSDFKQDNYPKDIKCYQLSVHAREEFREKLKFFYGRPTTEDKKRLRI